MKTRRSLRSLFGNTAVAAFLGLSLAVWGAAVSTAGASAATGLFVPPGAAGIGAPALRTILSVNSTQNPGYATNPYAQPSIDVRGPLVMAWSYSCRAGKPAYFAAALMLSTRMQDVAVINVTGTGKGATEVGPYEKDSGSATVHPRYLNQHLYLLVYVTDALSNPAPDDSNCQWHVRIQTPAADADSATSVPVGTKTQAALRTILNVTNATYNGYRSPALPYVTAHPTMTARWWYRCTVTGNSRRPGGYFEAGLMGVKDYQITPGDDYVGPFAHDSGLTVIHMAPRYVSTYRLYLAVAVTPGCRWQVKVLSP